MLGGFLSLTCLELLPHVGVKKSLMFNEVKIVESEKSAVAGNQTQDTWLVQPVLCH